MGIVDKIRSGFTGAYRTGRRYVGATALGLGIAAGSAALVGGPLYLLLRDNPEIAEQSMPQTRWSDHQINDWAGWKKAFVDKYCFRSNPEVCFVGDPSREHQITSESMSYGLLMSVQMDDQATFNKLFNGLNHMLGRGLPAWRAYLNGDRIEIRNDKDWSSATDADQDIAFALIQAHQRVQNGNWSNGHVNYGEKAQMFLNLLWENGVQYDGRTAMLKPSEDWGGATGTSGVVYNVSYASPAMYEVFHSFDANPAHRWDRLIADTLTLRQAIISAKRIKTGHGTETIELNGIPDWVSVAWTEKGIELFIPPPERDHEFGFESVRTLWRIALDIKMAQNPLIRSQAIEQAKQILDFYREKDVPAGVELFDPITGKSWPNKPIVLAALTVLAEAAGDTVLYNQYTAKMQSMYRENQGLYSNGVDAKPQDFYYDRAIIWLSLQTAEGGFRRFFTSRFSTGESKELQILRGQHYSSYGLMLEYTSWAGPERRAELDFMKRVLWFDEAEYLPAATEGREMEMRLARAGEAMSLRLLDEAARQYRIILENSDSASYSLEALNGISGAIEKAGLLPDAKVELFRELAAINPDNQFIQLGLARHLLELYRESASKEAVEIASRLTSTGDSNLRAQASIVSSQARIRLAKDGLRKAAANYEEFNSREERIALKTESLDNFDQAAKVVANALKIQGLTSKTTADLQRQLAEAYSAQGKALKDISILLTADPYYRLAMTSASRADAFSIELNRLDNLLEIARARTGVPQYGLKTNERELLSSDPAFQEILTALGARLDRVNELDPASRLQLYTKKISTQNLIEADPLTASEPTLEEVFRLLPHDRVRGHLERIIFFLNSGQVKNAIMDIESLARIATDLNQPDGISQQLLPLPLTNQMRNLSIKIRNHQRNTKINIDADLNAMIVSLTDFLRTNPDNRRAMALKAALTDFLNMDIESLAKIATDLDQPDSIPQQLLPLTDQMRNLSIKIHSYQRDTGIDIGTDLNALLVSLTDFLRTDPDNRRATDLKATLMVFLNKVEDNRTYEDLITLTQRLLEENDTINGYKNGSKRLIKLTELSGELADLRTILSSNDPRINEAVSQLEELVNESGERALDLDFYEKLVGALQAAAWAPFNSGDPEVARAILLELLEIEHPEPENMPVSMAKLIELIRDKENRGYINQLLGQNPSLRNQIFSDLAKMYQLQGDYVNAKKFYCQLLGIDSELTGAELNSAISAAADQNSFNRGVAQELGTVVDILKNQ